MDHFHVSAAIPMIVGDIVAFPLQFQVGALQVLGEELILHSSVETPPLGGVCLADERGYRKWAVGCASDTFHRND